MDRYTVSNRIFKICFLYTCKHLYLKGMIQEMKHFEQKCDVPREINPRLPNSYLFLVYLVWYFHHKYVSYFPREFCIFHSGRSSYEICTFHKVHPYDTWDASFCYQQSRPYILRYFVDVGISNFLLQGTLVIMHNQPIGRWSGYRGQSGGIALPTILLWLRLFWGDV